MKKLLFTLAIPFMVFGCANTQPIVKERPQFNSILVAPIINETSNMEVSDNLYYKFSKHLSEQGYYTFPMRTVLVALEQEGLNEPEMVYNLGPQKLSQLFGSDAVLFTKITYWDTKYNVLTSTTEAHIEIQIFTKDGAKLLDKKLVQTYSPNNAQSGILGNIITSAMQRALPNNDILALLLAYQLRGELLPGPY